MQVKVKKRALLLGLLLQLAVGFNAAGQITISPEVGVSYFPLKIGFPKEHASTASFLIGISGMVPIKELWSANARISYAPRNDLVWEYSGVRSGTHRDEYKHSDINVDFSISRKFLDWLHAGIGPSIVRKINTSYSGFFIHPDGSEEFVATYRRDSFNYGVNATLGIEFNGVLLKLEYYRQLKDEYQKVIVGKNRYNAVIAYPIKIKNR